jgi:transposase
VTRFRQGFGAQWHRLAQQSAPPLKLWALDEARFGLQTVRRRRLTLRGVKPIGAVQHRFENFYVYGAVCPTSGEGYFAAQRKMSQSNFAAFVRELSEHQPDYCHVLLLDNSATHKLAADQLPSNVRLLFQTPYAPELNPCERVWQEAKTHLAWSNPPDLLTLHDQVADLFEGYREAELRSLTAYAYLLNGLASDTALTALPVAA